MSRAYDDDDKVSCRESLAHGQKLAMQVPLAYLVARNQ
jgi:hypothetical protein